MYCLIECYCCERKGTVWCSSWPDRLAREIILFGAVAGRKKYCLVQFWWGLQTLYNMVMTSNRTAKTSVLARTTYVTHVLTSPPPNGDDVVFVRCAFLCGEAVMIREQLRRCQPST